MILDVIFGSLAGLSVALVLWQWVAALRFPLHQRTADGSFAPDVTLLKPLKGCDDYSEACLRSWFVQEYQGEIQIIFGVAKADDPVCGIVEKLMREFPKRDARLMVCEHLTGANAKVSKLARMEAEAKHELVVVSDADVWVPADFLANVVGPFKKNLAAVAGNESSLTPALSPRRGGMEGQSAVKADDKSSRGNAPRENEKRAREAQFGAETVNLAQMEVPSEVIAEVPQSVARQYCVIPVYKHDNTLTLAISDPSDLASIDSLSHLLRLEINLVVASEQDIEGALKKYYGDVPSNPASAKDSEGEVGLVNCFYRLANPATMAMRWEAVAINADFWSQVLQSRSLKPLDFALGAVMATRRKNLAEIGGFKSLENCLADDYQLGHRIAKRGHRIELSPVVVECRSAPMNWGEVWRHQLRWARTIRVCQPAPYFFSILSNATLWAVVLGLYGWAQTSFDFRELESGGMIPNDHFSPACGFALLILMMRAVVVIDLQRRMERSWKHALACPVMFFVKDLMQAAIWVGAFTGSGVEWRGQKFRVRKDGTLEKV